MTTIQTCKTSLRHIRRHSYLLLLFFLAFITGQAYGQDHERVLWIDPARTDQLSTNADVTPGNVQMLANNGAPKTNWVSSENCTEEPYIQVTLNKDDSRNVSDEWDLVIRILRADTVNLPIQPTAFEIQISETGNDGDWRALSGDHTYAYFVYREPNTSEFSERLKCDPNRNFRYMRLTCKETLTNKRNAHGQLMFALKTLQILKVKKGAWYTWQEFTDRNGNYCLQHTDRFHYDNQGNYTSYQYFLENNNYSLRHTMGVLDPKARKYSTVYQVNDITQNHIDNWCQWGNWDSNGKWTGPLPGKEISMPDMSLLTPASDPEIAQGTRQRTHVIEHDVYAMKGDMVLLSPFSTYTGSYWHTYAHWYDYKTGGRLKNANGTDLLDFLHDTRFAMPTKNDGWFGGKQLIGEKTGQTFEIWTAKDLQDFATRINNGYRCNAILMADIDCSSIADFTPIGKPGARFISNFDGNGHTIRNLNVQRYSYVGLFGEAGDGAFIRNLTIDESCNFSGVQYVGLIGCIWVNGGNVNPVIIESVINKGKYNRTEGTSSMIGGMAGVMCSQIKFIVRNSIFAGTTNVGSSYAVTQTWPDGETKGSITLENFVSNSERPLLDHSAKSINLNISNSFVVNTTIVGDAPTTLPTAISADEIYTQELANKIGAGWTLNGTVVPPLNKSEFSPAQWTEGEDQLTFFATFFAPRDTENPNLSQCLDDEYVIAADFSKSFSFKDHIGVNGKGQNEITEPALIYRHIFRVHDGAAFAEEFSGSAEKNQAYVKARVHNVMSRPYPAGGFQYRLTEPIPTPYNARVFSNIYYKKSDGTYGRLQNFKIKTTDTKTGNDMGGMFYLHSSYWNGLTSYIDGTTYKWGSTNHDFARMIACSAENAIPGTYKVQVLALDGDGNQINVYNSQTPLVVEEFNITFTPVGAALLVTEDELESNYPDKTEERLINTYGPANAAVDFDEYREAIRNPDGTFISESNDFALRIPHDGLKNVDYNGIYQFKWPRPWDQSTYGFCFGTRFDWSNYMLATHSGAVPFNAATIERQNSRDYAAKRNGSTGCIGIFDRLFYKTKGADHGFFYYVDASGDPGEIATVKLESFCPGSTLHVSAWIAEGNVGTDIVNVALNFVAVLKDANGNPGKRVPMHTFVSNYVPDDHRGEWMNVYYSFVPRLSDFKDLGLVNSDAVHHYELSLENNCVSSSGADYMVDDIRIYVSRPVVRSFQTTILCNKCATVDLKMGTPFDVLLQKLGLQRAQTAAEAENLSVFYTFLDRDVYESIYDPKDKDSYERAFNTARLKYNYSGVENGSMDQTYGQVKLNTFYGALPAYDKKAALNMPMSDMIDLSEYLAFNTQAYSEVLHSGKEYIAAFYFATGHDDKHPDAALFDLNSDCPTYTYVRVKGSGEIKIDGVAVPDLDNITVCENQRPVVQVNVYGQQMDESGQPVGDPIELDKNCYFDWYDGTNDEYLNEAEGDIRLADALTELRNVYPDASRAETLAPRGKFTKEMRDYIVRMSTSYDGKAPRLFLHQSSYVFPPAKFKPKNENPDDGEETKEEDSYIQVLAIPIPGEVNGYLVCSEPAEVRLKLLRHAPDAFLGMPVPGGYPEYMQDVPLRIGLLQLDEASAEPAEMANHATTLKIPLVKMQTTSKDIKRLKVDAGKNLVTMIETNDPAYHKLIDGNYVTDEDGNKVLDESLIVVGIVKGFTALTDGDYNTNAVEMVFDRNIQFREGYYYRLSFAYDEDLTGLTDITAENTPCSGRITTTLKVAPEYAIWTGATGNHNWHNDLNWGRVAAQDLYVADKPERKAALDRFISDGESNDMKFTYAPLDFTNTIVTPEKGVPFLYDVDASTKHEISVAGRKSTFFSDPNPKQGLLPDPRPGDTENIYDLLRQGATPDIQYDMVAVTAPANILTSAWYMNTCDEIDFTPGAWIVNQQHLIYNRAWAEAELNPSRWYTLSSPLQGVVAGDMYMPSANARQDTERFADITFKYGPYNRFRPAVFQRSWNKSSATVYELNGTDTRNVAIATTWSNVYNDVRVPYSAGEGFSIKNDVSRLGSAFGSGSKVLMRLPKQDTFYDYFNEDGSVQGNHTEIGTRTARLNDASEPFVRTVGAAKAGSYFLVGNPYMAYLDMEKFFDENPGLERKYWIMNENAQGAAIFGPAGITGTMDSESSRYLPPMQGFFVETSAKVPSVNVNFNNGMIAQLMDKSDKTLAIRSRHDGAPGMVITATGNGNSVSTALLRLDSGAGKDYGSEDAAMLFDPSFTDDAQVYSIAGHIAAVINALPDAAGTEIGLRTDADSEFDITFTNTADFSDLMLYDAQENTSVPVEDGLTVTVKGNTAGRLFLMRDTDGIAQSGIIVRTDDGGKVTVSSTATDADLSITVADMTGRTVRSLSFCGPVATFTLPAGIYAVHADDNTSNTVTAKLLIK